MQCFHHSRPQLLDVCYCVCVCVCTRTRDGNCSRSVLPFSFTNTCISLSGRKGSVFFSLFSSDTSQAFEGIAKGLMMPPLKARTCLYAVTDCNTTANYLIPPCVTVVDEVYSVSASPSVVCSSLCSPFTSPFLSFTSVCCSTCPPDALSVCVPHEQFGVPLQLSHH